MKLKVYCCDYEKDFSIDSSENCMMTCEEAVTNFNSIEYHPDNFWGMELADASCVQFMFLGRGRWEADIPDMKEAVTYNKECSHDEVVAIIREVFTKGAYPDLRTFTKNEM